MVDVNGAGATEPVEWVAPASPGDRRALDRWCETVGPAVVSTARADSDAQHRTNTLAVVSWNMHVGGGGLRRLVRDLTAGALTDGRPPTHFILLLQEAYRMGTAVPERIAAHFPAPSRIAPSTLHVREDIVRNALDLRLHLFYVPSMRNGRDSRVDLREDRGNAIASTLPLGELRAYELPFERQRRVAISAQVHHPTGAALSASLTVVNVHLENRAGRRRWWLRSGAARTRQVEALLERLPSQGPLVLGGDLNTWGRAERALEELRSQFDRRPHEDARATFRDLRLDYVFFRALPNAEITYRVLDDAYGSDHRPVLGLIAWAELAERAGHAPSCNR